jgi:AraC-like DNA-binding protein/mannose-6-phosphate isomerase-like protein (cupin superfamily)
MNTDNDGPGLLFAPSAFIRVHLWLASPPCGLLPLILEYPAPGPEAMHGPVKALHFSDRQAAVNGGARVRLDFCNTHRCLRGRDVRHHTHQALELVYYTEGQGTSTIAGTTHPVSRGIFTITPAGVHHDQRNHTDLGSICVGLSGSSLERLRGAWPDPGGELGRACARLVRELAGLRPGHERVRRGLVEEIAGLAERAAAESARPTGRRGVVARAIEAIQDQGGALSVAELAEQLYVSRDYLRHLFKEYAGASPMRHIIQARIERAKDLLADRELSIKEVSRRCGFDSQYYFSRLFRKVTGMAPSAFRGGGR